MQLVAQNKDCIVPFNGARLNVKDAYTIQIVALTPSGEGRIVAAYDDYDRAKSVLEEIARNEATGERRVYYLPKK